MRDNATLTTLYSADTIVVGDSMFSDEEEADYGELRYWSDRLPETIGRGGLLMHPIVDREHYAEHYWNNGGSYCHDYVPFRWHHFTPITIGIDQWSQRDMWRSRQATKERGLATVARATPTPTEPRRSSSISVSPKKCRREALLLHRSRERLARRCRVCRCSQRRGRGALAT
jgi:hypothetical protein